MKAEVDRLFDRIAAARDGSPLPPEPDSALAEELSIDITQTIWSQSR